MIILTKEILDNEDKFNEIIEKEKNLINLIIDTQKTLKNMLLDHMQKLVASTDNLSPEYCETILKILEDFKNSLKFLQINMDLLDVLLQILNNLKLDINVKANVNNFNRTYIENNMTILKNTAQIENVLYSILPFSTFSYIEVDNSSVEPIPSFYEDTKNIVATNSSQNIDKTEIVENTLIISETKGKVFLPYTLSILDDILENNKEQYSSIEDVIEKQYTLSLDLFKNPIISRFRETFKLLRKKEKKSFKEAFDLGMELLFNYNLHPAIISACRNSDELDIYLDYLEENETDKFNCFNIIFEMPPILSKKRRSSY